MRDQTIKGIINAIPLLIILVAVILPLSAHGWDITSTVLPENSFLQPGPGPIPGIGGISIPSNGGSMISVGDTGFTADGSRVFLEVRLRNPMPAEVEVKAFTATAPLGSTRVNLALVQPVTIPAGGTGTARLEGTAPGSRPTGGFSPSLTDLRNLKMTLSSGGMEMNLDENTVRGMLS